jgi:hypothetical protein
MPKIPPKKTALYLFLFILFSLTFNWFVISLPIEKFNDYAERAPIIINDYISDIYPEDLMIDVSDGEVSINRQTPYCLIFNRESAEGIVFDDNAQLTVPVSSSLTDYNDLCRPWALVGKNFLLFPDSLDSLQAGSYRIQEIPAEADFLLSKEIIDDLLINILPILLRLARTLYFLAPFLIVIFSYSALIFANYFYAFIAKIVIKKSKINTEITYKQVRKKSLFILFLWTVFNWVIIKFFINDLLNVSLNLSSGLLSAVVVVVATVFLEKHSVENSSESAKQADVSKAEATQIPQPPPLESTAKSMKKTKKA